MGFRMVFNMQAACEFLGLTEDRIRALVRDGKLKTLSHYENSEPQTLLDVHLKESLLFKRDDLLGFQEKNARENNRFNQVMDFLKFIYEELASLHNKIDSVNQKVVKKLWMTT